MNKKEMPYKSTFTLWNSPRDISLLLFTTQAINCFVGIIRNQSRFAILVLIKFWVDSLSINATILNGRTFTITHMAFTVIHPVNA